MVKKRGYRKRGKGVRSRYTNRVLGVRLPFSIGGRKLRVGGKHFFKRTGNVLTSTYAKTLTGPVGQAPGITFSPGDDCMYLSTGGGSVSASTYYSIAYQFDLGCMPDYTDFTNLFDQYKICGIKMKILAFSGGSMLDPNSATAPNQSLAVLVHSIIDYDDASPMAASSAGIQAMREFESYRSQNMFDQRKGCTWKRYVRPHIAEAAFGGTVFTSYANKGPQWLDTNSGSDIKHYGMKIIFEVVEPLIAQTAYIWLKPEVTFYIACKNVR